MRVMSPRDPLTRMGPRCRRVEVASRERGSSCKLVVGDLEELVDRRLNKHRLLPVGQDRAPLGDAVRVEDGVDLLHVLSSNAILTVSQ